MLHAENRMIVLGRPEPSVIQHGKFHVYDLVRSHGIEIPEQYGRWADARDIPWDELPDRVVVKAMRGASSRGVFPVERHQGGWRVISHDADVVTGDQLSARLADDAEQGTISGPFGAEEFLDEDGTGARPPTDVKVYTFYGEAPLVLLRRVDVHGNRSTASFRIVDRGGRDLSDRYMGKRMDPAMDVPARLGEIVDVAERLSIALRAPFSRIDLYGIRDRIVFGEVTPRPGGAQWLGRDLDTSLGDAWERAKVRLSRDLADGLSREPEWGPVPVPGNEDPWR
jgi:TupA-like ATPgrasp